MPQLTKTISRLEKNNEIGYNSIVHNSELISEKLFEQFCKLSKQFPKFQLKLITIQLGTTDQLKKNKQPSQYVG